MKKQALKMKKHTLKAITAALAAMFVLSACGGGGGGEKKGNSATYEDMGYYTIYAMETEEDSYKRKDLRDEGKDGIYLWLDEDGAGELYLIDDTYDLEWEDGKILDLDGEEADYTLDGGKIEFTIDIEGEEYTFTFRYKDEELPEDAGTSSGKAEEEETTDTAKEDEKEEEPAEKPAKPSGSATADYVGLKEDFNGAVYEIVSAQAITDSDGRDAVRLFYDFTNNTDTTIAASDAVYSEVTQGGIRLNSSYVGYNSEYVALEDDNYRRSIRPGVTIRCSRIFAYNPQGGDIDVKIYDGFGSNAKEFNFTMSPASFASERPDELEIATIADPQWTKDLPGGVGLQSDEATYSIEFVKSEATTNYDGDLLVRVYYKVENLGSNTIGSRSYDLDCYLRAYQDGVELDSGYARDQVNAEKAVGMDIAPGESLELAECFTLRSDSTVEFEFYTYEEGAVAGASVGR